MLQHTIIKPIRIQTCPGTEHCDGFCIVNNLPPDHPQAGHLIPCACTRAQWANAIQVTLSPTLQRMTFEAFKVNDDNRDAFNHAYKFAQNPWGQECFFLTMIGPNRIGKTHLAAAIINALLAHGEPAYFENVPALLDDLRSGYQDDSFHDRLRQVKTAQVLVLDDIGAESAGGSKVPYAVTWAHDKLYQIIDHRVINELPTVMTTNLTPDKLPQRIASRLWDQHLSIVVAVQ